MKSVDGRVWTDVLSTVLQGVRSGDANRLFSLGVGDGVWLAFGSWEKKYYSIRGGIFNVSKFPGVFQVLCLAYGNRLWIACDPYQTKDQISASGVLYSQDGGNTFVRSSSGMAGLRDAVYAQRRGFWVGVRGDNGTSEMSGVSNDGITWDTRGSNAHLMLENIFAVVFSDRLNLFLATGKRLQGSRSSVVISSPDGLTWSPMGLFADIDIAGGNDLAVAELANGTVVIVVAGDAGTFRRSQIMVSYDEGRTWIGKVSRNYFFVHYFYNDN